MICIASVFITVNGSGFYEIDRSGSVKWSHKNPEASHDADRLPNGNKLVENSTVRNLGVADDGTQWR